jgi:hypothetical protein
VRVLEVLGIVLAVPGAIAALWDLWVRHVLAWHVRRGGWTQLDIHIRFRIHRG